MTSDELAFIAALDAEPENHGLRQIFADWLDDRGDPRGPGMRALGRLELRCCTGGWFRFSRSPKSGSDPASDLFDAWFDALEGGSYHAYEDPGDFGGVRYYRNDTIGNDAAAIAWAKLSPSQQARILADAGVTV